MKLRKATRKLVEQRYEILVCPVCHKQIGEPDREESPTCWHDEYGSVEPIVVEALPVGLEAASALARFRLQDQRREWAFTQAERSWFRNLPKAEQDRLEAERRSKMSPIALVMEDMIKDSLREDATILNRQGFWTDAEIIPAAKGQTR